MTDLVSTIDSGGGGDYTTWQAWEDACSSDLVADGNNWIGEQIDEEITTSTTTTISGITTDATNRLIMRCTTGSSFVDNATPGTDPLRYDITKGAAVRRTTNYGSVFDQVNVRVEVSQLQFKSDLSSVVWTCSTSTQPLFADQCIFDGKSGSNQLVVYRNSGDRSKLTNCVIVSDGDNGEGILGRDYDARFCTFYCTATTPGSVVAGSYGVGDFDNCLFLNFADWQTSTQVHLVDYCVTDVSSWESSTAANSVLNATVSDEIKSDSGVRTTCDLSAKAGGSSDGGGSPVSGVTIDIYGQTRDGSTPTVGAFEIVSAGPAGTAGRMALLGMGI